MLNSPNVPVPVRFATLHAAWRRARRGKKPSANQLRFDARWMDGLLDLHMQLRQGSWQPRRTVCFVVTRPKTREIHAPDFADRIVHHVLVAQLEKLYEPVFIHDSYANRQGKGSHAAVLRLQSFMRQRNGKGWFLQLDVHNFFNTIHRPTLYGLLCQRLEAAERRMLLPASRALALRSLCHKLLAKPTQEYARAEKGARSDWADVPAHKQLRNAKPGCGVPIGNLSSQFFANVVLNELDQYVKHTLKVRHYVRYVDDFVLVADSPATLAQWHAQIDEFLQAKLRLTLKTEATLAPLQQGADFLGYLVRASHLAVRRRVVAHCRAKLRAWALQHVRVARSELLVRALPQALAQLQAVLASYWGHFAHAASVRLRRLLWARFAWLRLLFDLTSAGELVARWVLHGATFSQQCQWLQAQWPQAHCTVQRGFEQVALAPAAFPTQGRVKAVQTGWLQHGTRRREITSWRVPLHAWESSTSTGNN